MRGDQVERRSSYPGALAGWGRRIAALAIDWLVANLTVFGVLGLAGVEDEVLLRGSPLLVFAVQVWLLTWLLGGSFGQRVVGVVVVKVDGGRLNSLAVLIRTVLICLVIPPLVFDKDGRGLHDMAVNSVAVRG